MTGNIQSNYVNDITDSRGIMGACRKRAKLRLWKKDVKLIYSIKSSENNARS